MCILILNLIMAFTGFSTITLIGMSLIHELSDTHKKLAAGSALLLLISTIFYSGYLSGISMTSIALSITSLAVTYGICYLTCTLLNE